MSQESRGTRTQGRCRLGDFGSHSSRSVSSFPLLCAVAVDGKPCSSSRAAELDHRKELGPRTPDCSPRCGMLARRILPNDALSLPTTRSVRLQYPLSTPSTPRRSSIHNRLIPQRIRRICTLISSLPPSTKDGNSQQSYSQSIPAALSLVASTNLSSSHKPSSSLSQPSTASSGTTPSFKTHLTIFFSDRSGHESI